MGPDDPRLDSPDKDLEGDLADSVTSNPVSEGSDGGGSQADQHADGLLYPESWDEPSPRSQQGADENRGRLLSTSMLILLGSTVLLVPMFYIVGLGTGLSCGSTVNPPCDGAAETSWMVWLGVTAISVIPALMLVDLRNTASWAFLPLATGATAAVLILYTWNLGWWY